ncbi:MAG: glutamate-1-semialdehyde-2,1-aminomutase [Sphingobacteriia bacterium]|nr:glutamate-1-semialdehyde-2,1-aminomutase [Sphingobacteriia bacterium]
MNTKISNALFQRALLKIPGGVNSPVRAFRSVGGNPRFIRKASGAWLEDVDGNRYLDLINSWGPMILGHAHPEIIEAVQEVLADSFSFGAPNSKEVEMAELICELVPSVEKVRMVNSGTEATMSAIRVARGFTQREKIIKFEGCYHGHGDSFLIAAGSGAMTFGIPDSKGVTKGVAQDTLTAPFNDLGAVEQLLEANPNQIAAIIVEPVVGNMGLVIPQHGFLAGLRKLCDQHHAVLIFDEVMTGFRLSISGAQGLYGITPDLTTFGKIIGGGLPVGAYGGKKEIMDQVSPVGPVYQAGTLSGNPLAMAAGLATLTILKNDIEIYNRLDKNGEYLETQWKAIANKYNIPVQLNRVGSMFTLFFTADPVHSFSDARKSDTERFAKFFNGLLNLEVYPAPSQFEAMFLSDALLQEDLLHLNYAVEEVMKGL